MALAASCRASRWVLLGHVWRESNLGPGPLDGRSSKRAGGANVRRVESLTHETPPTAARSELRQAGQVGRPFGKWAGKALALAWCLPSKDRGSVRHPGPAASRRKPTPAAAAPFRANGQFGRQLDEQLPLKNNWPQRNPEVS
jgi:hypothetical protein